MTGGGCIPKLAGTRLFIFRNSGSFRNSEAQGGYSWVSPLQSNEHDRMALNYLENFYRTAVFYKNAYSLGTGYKGFNDSIALWNAHRLIDQQCGQTWLTSIADANSHYSVDDQMAGIQLVTWNDYEEGTEFESGIDNCVDCFRVSKGRGRFLGRHRPQACLFGWIG